MTIDEHLTIVRAEGDLRSRLVSTLQEAGWLLVGDDDLPSPDAALLAVPWPEEAEADLEAARDEAAAADRLLLEVLSEMETVNAAVETSERRGAELEGLSDLLAAELRQPRHAEDPTERLGRIVDGASGLGFDRFAPELAAWVDQIAAGTAPADPLAGELISRRAQLETELQQGVGSVDLAPDVLRAHARRHELRSMIVELELMLERGLTPENQRLIDDAHQARVAAEEQSGRRGTAIARDALAAEEAALARFGYASYPDFQISTSTRSVGEHAEATLVRVRQDLAEAEAALERATSEAEGARERLRIELDHVEAAIEERACGRSIDGILARPDALSELHDSVHDARESELIEGSGHRDRRVELYSAVAERTQAAAAAEAVVESAATAHAAVVARQLSARSELDRAEADLALTLGAMLEVQPVVLVGDVSWLGADRLVSVLEQVTVDRPLVLCTDRDIAPGRAVEGPRWWQFRRRARQAAPTG